MAAPYFADGGAAGEADPEAEALAELQAQIALLDYPLDDGFITKDTLLRYLRARNGNVKATVKMLAATVKWRCDTLRELNAAGPSSDVAVPQLSMASCRFCTAQLGFHPMRQVGFDTTGRPILYVAFAQATNYWFKVADAQAHLVPVLENAAITMTESNSSQFVWIIDYTGFGLGSCNPMQSSVSIKMLQNHYPERLARAICINAPWGFSGFWGAVSAFMDERTKKKVTFCSSEAALRDECVKFASAEMVEWLCTEQRLNKKSPMPPAQKAFWTPPDPAGEHDPRGEATFVQRYIDTFAGPAGPLGQFYPHPNIQQTMTPPGDAAADSAVAESAAAPDAPATHSHAAAEANTAVASPSPAAASVAPE